MKISDLPNSEKPRERLIKYGVDKLSDTEILSIILRTGTKNTSVKDLSTILLKQINGIDKLYNITFKDLSKIKGIGNSKACSIIASLELGKRLSMKKYENIKLNNSENIFNYIKDYFNNINQEVFIVICLDSKKNLISYREIFRGTLNESIIHPREIFKYAYEVSASSIVIVHNHPSKDVTPSKEDIEITRIITEISKIMKISLIDHLIIGNNNYYSFYNDGRINNEKIIF